jgi:hypothetical protein
VLLLLFAGNSSWHSNICRCQTTCILSMLLCRFSFFQCVLICTINLMLPRSLSIQTALSNGLQSLLQPPQKQLHSVCRYFTVHICSVDMPTGLHRRDLMRNQARTISPCFSYHLRDLLFQPDSNRTQVFVPYFFIAGIFLSTCRRLSSDHYIPKRTKAGLHPVIQLGLLSGHPLLSKQFQRNFRFVKVQICLLQTGQHPPFLIHATSKNRSPLGEAALAAPSTMHLLTWKRISSDIRCFYSLQVVILANVPTTPLSAIMQQ